MRWLVALGLVLLASLTAVRLPAWRDQRSILLAAVETSPELARPALNLGIVLIRQGDHAGGSIWLLKAAELAEARRGPRDAEVLAAAKRGFLWLEAFGTPICSWPAYQRYC